MYFLVNHEKKFMIGWSAKAGCCAIKKWYIDVSKIYLGDRDIHAFLGYGNTKFSDIRNPDRKGFNDYKKFICIRNPYKRVVSAYVNKYIVEKAYPVKGWSTFEEFISVLHRDRKFRKINKHHFIQQTGEDFYIAERNQWEWDKIIELDNFRDDMLVVNKMLLTDTEIPGKINYSKYSPTKNFKKQAYKMSATEIEEYMPGYSHFYNSNIKEIVCDIYMHDFEYFDLHGIHYE